MSGQITTTTKNTHIMKAKFEVTNWLSANRDSIIAKYEALTKEKFFQGHSLKMFMVEILQAMQRNNVKSEKTAASKLPFLMGQVYFDFSNPSAQANKSNY